MCNRPEPSKKKQLLVFILTIFFGYIIFIIPNLFFGITKFNGGLTGVNLFYTAVFQLVFVILLLVLSLKCLNKYFKDIGLRFKNLKFDIILGLIVALCWIAIQFLFIIPNTGGADRDDIFQMLSTMDGTALGIFSYMALGVIGGGITEEIFNRGYFISVLKETFNNEKIGLIIASILSVIIFVAGHLPTSAILLIDILIPTILYTLLFLYTKRLTAPIVAHGLYNLMAILLTYQLYYLC